MLTGGSDDTARVTPRHVWNAGSVVSCAGEIKGVVCCAAATHPCGTSASWSADVRAVLSSAARCAAVRVASVVEVVVEAALDALLLDDPPPRVRAKAAAPATSTATAMMAIVRDEPGTVRLGAEE